MSAKDDATKAFNEFKEWIVPKKKTLSTTSVVFLASSLFFILILSPSTIYRASGYELWLDNSVDADSNVDSVANIGDDGTTSYLEAQTKDGTDQEIVEGQGSGYVAGNNVEDFVDAVTNTQNPADLGTYSAWTEMQDQDGAYNTLTEENVPTAGVNEWVANDANAGTLSNAEHVGSGTFLELQDTNNYLDLTKGSGYAQWYTFASTSGSGSDFAVNLSIYVLWGDGNDDIQWQIDTTGDDNAEFSGQFTDPTSGYYNTGTISGLDTDTEINAARLKLISIASGQHQDHEVDQTRLGVSRAGSNNYRFDREISWSSLDNDETNEELCIYVQTCGSETLDIDVWHSGAWTDIGTDIVDANDGSWVNISIATWLDASTEYFRFEDTVTTSDTGENTWILDAVLIHVWTDAINDYELQWEHQCQSVDTDKDAFSINIFGHSSDAETFTIRPWNPTTTEWDSSLGTIGSAEQWYNNTITSTHVDSTNDWITWIYNDTDISSDSTQTTLHIDYAGISCWNFSIDILETTMSLSSYDPGSGNITFAECPLTINISSGIQYDVEIRAVDGDGSPVSNNYLFFDIDSDPTGATQLTSTYQILYNDRSFAEEQLILYVFVAVPFGIGDQTMTFTLYAKITTN